MSTLQFPKNPSINDEYDWEGFKYVYDGQKWKTIGVGYNPVNDLKDKLEPRIDELEDDVTQLQSGNSSLVQAVNSLNVRVTAEEKDTKDWEGFTAELLAQGGVPDNGQPDEIGNSQRVEAILEITKSHSRLADVTNPNSHPASAISRGASNVDADLGALELSVSANASGIASLSATDQVHTAKIAALESGQGSGVVAYATRAELFANLNYSDRSVAYVTNDTTTTYNGTYRKSGASGTGSWAQSSNDMASQAYQKSTANEARKADKSQLEFESTADETDRLYLIDADGRITATIEDTDKMFRPVDFETTYSSETSIYVIDADNRLITSVGSDNQPATDAALKDRVDKSLNEFGLNRTHKFGEWYLRETRQRTRKMLLNEAQKLTILMIGDSWTHAAIRYSGNFGLEMQKAFGGTSAGFTGFSWGYGTPPNAGWNTNFDPSTTSIAISGAWVVKYGNQTSPDICAASSSTAGDTIVITTTREATSALLFANNNSAQIRYRYNSGAWNSLTLSGAVEYFTLATPPVGSFDITFEVVSGVCDLYGLSLTNDGSGVVIHKVGATGSQLAAWANLSNNPEWRANIAALAPNLITILHGTNDQDNYTAAQFKANGQILINNIRSVLPLCDILLISPCENGRVTTIPMAEYQDVTQQLAYENKCAFLNLQHVFGDSFSEYASTSPRNWFNADLIHPEPSTGGRAILDAVYKIITE